MKIFDAAEAMVRLERTVAAVKDRDVEDSKIARALLALESLSRKEGIPLAIVGGLAAIHHGYERFGHFARLSLQSGGFLRIAGKQSAQEKYEKRMKHSRGPSTSPPNKGEHAVP